MANKRMEAVGYRPFEANPILADGLLSVQRDDGALERKVAQGLANLADQFGQQADRQAAEAGAKQGALDAMNGAPGASTITGGDYSGTTASVNGQAGHVRGAQGGVVVRVPPQQIRTIIADAAVRHGVDPNALTQFAGIESSFNPASYNRGSGASGLFQFVPGTARQYGLSNPFDPAQSADAAARLMRDNTAALQHGLGRAPTAGELYLAHQQGVGGALKLLKNPDANAAQLVGEKAVASNGGSIGMTAGQFASLWTSRVSGSSASYVDPVVVTNHPSSGSEYAQLPSAASVAPISVTPVRAPVEIAPGKTGSFRPRNDGTIYGRAYDVQGTRTYLQMLDNAMLSDQAQVYEAYKDDPVQLQQALGQLKARHLQDDVFPEIAPDYTVSFDRQANELVQRSRAAFDLRKKEQDKVDFLDRVQTLEDQKGQRLAGLQANDPTAAASLANQQSLIDEHYKTAAARGLLSPEEAQAYIRKSRSDTVTSFYTRQAANKSPEDILQLRKDMTRDYAAGNLAGVTPDDWERIDKGLVAAASARKTQDDKANEDLKTRGDDIADRVARGLPVDPANLARFQLDAATAPKGKEIVGSTLTRIKFAEALRTQTLAEVQKQLPSILGQGATPDDYDYAQKTMEAYKKELQTDPLGVAERYGVLPPSPGLPLDGDPDPSAVAGAFAERVNAARAAATHFGVQPKYFRPGEAQQISDAVAQDPQRGLAIAAGLVAAGGRDAGKVLAELGTDAPAISQSGEIIRLGGDPKAALDLITSYGKSPDGKSYSDMPVTLRMPLATEVAGGALVFTPDQQVQIDAAANAIARKRLYDAGIKATDSSATKPIYERAYNEAAGAIYANNVQYGGFGSYDPGFWWRSRKVLVPNTIRADRFEDVVQSLNDGDVGQVKAQNGRTWTAADFKKALPVAVNGGYVFALGDPQGSSPQFIADDKGNPVVLDIAGMKDQLSARNPGAFR